MKIRVSLDPKILVTRTDRIGDLVLTTPVFKALKEKFPTSKVSCLTFLENREIVEGNPYLEEVLLYDKKGSEKGWWGQLLFSLKLRKKEFDIVIHCHGTNRMHLLGWLAGIPVRIGYDRRASWALTQTYSYNKKEGQKHESEYLFDLLEVLDVQVPASLETYFPITDRFRASLENLLAFYKVEKAIPIIVLSPSASDQTKMWPAKYFGELVTRLDQEGKSTFIAIGKREDRGLVSSLRENTSVSVIDFSGRLSLGMLGALLKRSNLLVSNDSGPVHIAGAVGCPVVSIFGRHQAGLNAKRWEPLAAHSQVVVPKVDSIPEGERDFTYIDQITVEEVFQASLNLKTKSLKL